MFRAYTPIFRSNRCYNSYKCSTWCPWLLPGKVLVLRSVCAVGVLPTAHTLLRTDTLPGRNQGHHIWYIFSCNWVDTRWQQYSSHLHTSSTPNTKNGTYITITKLNTHKNKNLTNLWSAGRAPSLWVILWHFPYNWGKSTEKPQLG